MEQEPVVYGVNAGASLLALILYLVAWGVLISAGAAELERRYGPKWVWTAWAVIVALLPVIGAVASHRLFPDAGTVLSAFYMIAMFVGVPAAVAAWVTIWVGRARVRPSWWRQIGFTFVAFIAAVPVGVVLAALPDLARLFSS